MLAQYLTIPFGAAWGATHVFFMAESVYFGTFPKEEEEEEEKPFQKKFFKHHVWTTLVGFGKNCVEYMFAFSDIF